MGVLDEIKALSAQLGLGFGLSLAKKFSHLLCMLGRLDVIDVKKISEVQYNPPRQKG